MPWGCAGQYTTVRKWNKLVPHTEQLDTVELARGGCRVTGPLPARFQFCPANRRGLPFLRGQAEAGLLCRLASPDRIFAAPLRAVLSVPSVPFALPFTTLDLAAKRFDPSSTPPFFAHLASGAPSLPRRPAPRCGSCPPRAPLDLADDALFHAPAAPAHTPTCTRVTAFSSSQVLVARWVFLPALTASPS